MMASRRYNQRCPVASTLDLIGERWTLLIVRDLLLGPLRFSDLLARLPGVGRNLLASRLRYLLSEGVADKELLEPPYASTVYRLTEKGRALQNVIMELGSWGMRYGKKDTRTSEHLESDLFAFAFLHAVVSSGRPLPTRPTTHYFIASGVPFQLQLAPPRPIARRGATDSWDVRFEAEVSFWLRILTTRQLDFDAALADGELLVSRRDDCGNEDPVDASDQVAAALAPYGIAVLLHSK